MADAADASAADRWLAEAKSLVKQHAFHMKRATVRGDDARGRRRGADRVIARFDSRYARDVVSRGRARRREDARSMNDPSARRDGCV